MEQRAFYEIEKPKRKKYFVIVLEDTTLDDTPCTIPDCSNNTDTVYECFCCGQWFCVDHTNKNGFCPDCAKLPKGIQDDIITFRDNWLNN